MQNKPAVHDPASQVNAAALNPAQAGGAASRPGRPTAPGPVASVPRGIVLRGIVAAVLACALLCAAGCAAGQAGQAGTAGQATVRPSQLNSPSSAPPAPVTASRPPRPRPLPLAGDVIVIDPGHNGGNAAHPEIVNRLVNVITEQKACDTTGAETDAGYPEYAFNFDVAIRLARLLRKDGAKVVLTRHSDTGVGPCVTERAAIGNRAHASAAISIHADGGPAGGSGFEVIEPGLVPGYTDKIIGPSRRLGLDIRNTYHAITGEPYSDYIGTAGLDVRTDLGGLNLSTVPKVFIECANMRNSGDAARITSAAFRQRIAVAIAAGFIAFLHGR
jgi:N-acetylmuramoyl-L-alanine amidase